MNCYLFAFFLAFSLLRDLICLLQNTTEGRELDQLVDEVYRVMYQTFICVRKIFHNWELYIATEEGVLLISTATEVILKATESIERPNS